MKQLLSLFLFLLPCFTWAQYPSNGNQKITLGEQTTADGLIFRGVLGDTALITPLSDTSAYIILDTANHRFYNYNRATNVWSVAGGGTAVTTFSAGTTGLTPSTATSGAVTLGGTLAVANGGTNRTTMPAGYILHGDGTSVDTAIGLFWDRSLRFLGVGTTSPALDITISSSSSTPAMAFAQSFTNTSAQRGGFQWLNNSNSTVASIIALAQGDNVGTGLEFSTRPVGGALTLNMVLRESGRLGIGTPSPTEQLHVVGNARITAVGAGTYSNDLNITSTGVLTTASSSDETFKYNINPITYGLSTILQLKPVSFQWKKGDEHDLGFIAQDAVNIIPEAVDTFWDSSLLFRSNTIIPILTKAIQEQQALIKALEQRIINLENK
jgi:hypothetical protein